MSLPHIRGLFQQAARDKKQVSALKRAIRESQDASSALKTAYQAAAIALEADMFLNPLMKLHYFRRSATTFDRAVSMDPHHPEIRFLRFMINIHAPKVLQTHLSEDKKVMIRGFLDYAAFDLTVEEVEAWWQECLDTGIFLGSETKQMSTLFSGV